MASSGFEASEVVPPEGSGHGDRERGEALVLELVGSQADSLLRVARRYSMCADDAHDAYQRGLEILMRHAARLDPERAAGWLHTVVKHEALAINRSRRRIVGFSEVDLDALESRTSASPEEHVLASDRVARSAEALHGLKPQEVRALWLKALGHSYEQICEATGWTYTKVNRCLAEGRKSFLERYAGIESGQECERLAPTLSAFVDGEADAAQTVALRAHLRQCLACRAAVRGLHDASRPLAVVFPATGARAGQRRRRAHGQLLRARVRDGLAAPARARGELVPARAGGLRHRHGRQDGRRGGVGRGGRRRRLRRRGRRDLRARRSAGGDPARGRGQRRASGAQDGVAARASTRSARRRRTARRRRAQRRAYQAARGHRVEPPAARGREDHDGRHDDRRRAAARLGGLRRARALGQRGRGRVRLRGSVT